VMVTILSIHRVYPHGIYAYITYKAKIDKVIAKPRNTVETLPRQSALRIPLRVTRLENNMTLLVI